MPVTDEIDDSRAMSNDFVVDGAGGRNDVRWSLVMVALLLVPFVVSAFYLWFSIGTSYLPNVDLAAMELRVRDTLGHGTFVGPYSRYGWSHPGPFMFYVLAVFYKVFGSRSISMQITALIINASTIAAIAWVAFRRGRLVTLLTVLVPLAVLTRALGAAVLRDPWNPELPLLPLLLLLLLVWSVTVGDVWMLPFAMVVASFVVQSHVGYSLEVLALLAVAIVSMLIQVLRTPRASRRSSWMGAVRAWSVALVVLVLLWLPVLYGTFVKHDGNISRLLDFFTSDRQTAGLSQGFKLLSLQWGPRPEWIVGSRGIDFFGNNLTDARWWTPVWLVLAAAATIVALRRRATATLWFAGLLGVGLVAALLAMSAISGPAFPYLTQWTWVLGAALGILVMQGLWLAVPPERRAAVLRVATPLAVVVLVVISGFETVDALTAGPPTTYNAREHTLTREVIAHLPPGHGTVLIDVTTGAIYATGLALALERNGIPVAATPSNPVVYGPWRTPDGGPYRAKLKILAGRDQIRDFPGAWTLIARYSRPLNSDDRSAIRHRMDQAIHLAPGAIRDAMIRSIQADRRGPAEDIRVYLTDPSTSGGSP